MTQEAMRLQQAQERTVHWRRWGPYLSERQWGTVREDYSPSGAAWDFLSHDHARSRAYRWGEDGLAGICDNHQRLCFALALWNGRDPILKERLFGLTGSEGNHGEDVKEYYFYLCIALALVDPDFAKHQLTLFLREWYMHPNGQIPAYEWAFSDVNPPVHAWAAWRVYKIEKRVRGKADRAFLERVFHKLLLNFNWWVNRKDAEGNNVFEGGFLGLDNIGVFDRSAPLPTGGHIEQS